MHPLPAGTQWSVLSAGEAGGPECVDRPRRQLSIGPAVPRRPGPSCREPPWKRGLSKALPWARPYFQSPNPASEGEAASPPARPESKLPEPQKILTSLQPSSSGPLHCCLFLSPFLPRLWPASFFPTKPPFLSDQLARVTVWIL